MNGHQRGFSLLEAVAALALFGMAIVVAAGFLDAHMSAARRLEARGDLVRAAEVVLESLRGEALPLTGGAIDLSDQFPGRSSAQVSTRVRVTPRNLTGLYEVRVEARTVIRSEEMVVTVTTQMWKP
jgi:prepilin-type N-terminal cleavage/methylation domain-containing protein